MSGRTSRRAGRRRRLRRGVRLAGWSLLALAVDGRHVHDGLDDPRRRTTPACRSWSASAFAALPVPLPPSWRASVRPSTVPADGDAIAVGPALGAPVADAEFPVVFPGYVLPDDSREEPAHEGS